MFNCNYGESENNPTGYKRSRGAIITFQNKQTLSF